MKNDGSFALAVCGLVSLAVAIGVGRFAFTPLLPMMQKDNGLTLRAAGLLASANYLGYFAGAMSAIWLRASTASILRVSMPGVALLTVAMGLVHGLPAWALLRFVAGVASAWVLIFASAYILDQLNRRGKTAGGGIVFGGVGSGIAASGLLCLLFLALSWSADRAWIALGLVALALSAWCLPFYRSATAAGSAPGGAALRLRDHATVIACYGIFGFGYIIPATFLPAMARRLVADSAAFAWAWPIFGAAALASTLAAGRLAGRWPNRAVWAASHAIMALGVVLPVLMSDMAGIAASSCLVGGTFMVATMTGMQEARLRAPEHAARLMAAMTAAFGIGQILGPLLVSLLAGRDGGTGAALAASGALLLGSAAVLAGRGQAMQGSR
ncbi:MAG TPA: YbfB/YjiJ family MFS transporter [Burkholderiales bacterium]|nr:YbfB/YjiJ family MFS transporter [Burkholderiales bacterium]